MSYQRCFSSLGCPQLSLDDVWALARVRDIPAVELRALGGAVALPSYLSERYGSPAALAARPRGGAPAVVALGTSLALATASEAERGELLAWAPWAEALGARWLRVFDGGRSGGADEIEHAAATLAWWDEARRRAGWRVELMVETHDSLLTAAAVGRLVAAAPGVGILWDAHHTWRRGGEDPEATWTAIREWVVHVHVKDSRRRADNSGAFDYVLPGEGEFPFAALVARLRREGFGGAVSLEWERQWHPQLGPLEDALEAAKALGW